MKTLEGACAKHGRKQKQKSAYVMNPYEGEAQEDPEKVERN